MTQEDILDIRRRALEDAAQLAYDMSEQNRVQALKLHLRSNKQAAAGFDEAADHTKISAQVLDACAEEGRCIAERIRALKPRLPAIARSEGD